MENAWRLPPVCLIYSGSASVLAAPHRGALPAARPRAPARTPPALAAPRGARACLPCLYTRLRTAVIAANATAWLPSLGRALQLRE